VTPVASPWMIDLHTHSTVSDGSDRPERIPELAVEAGCSAVALTDHDSLAGIEAARRRAVELGVTFVPGCEVSCRPVGTGGMHVLVYFVEDDGGQLCEELGRLRQDRKQRNLALADRLAALGVPVTYDMVVAQAGGEEGVGRPHFASAMVAVGAAETIDDAFERFLSNNGPGFVAKSRLSAAEVARLARLSGGVAVLAHPFSNGLVGPDLARVVGELAEEGFSGIEALYGRYSPRQRQQLGNLARRFDLVATGGSDHHGVIKPDLRVGTGRGDLKVPDNVLAQLEARRPGG
jgi:3',5'-nucleoside bisphosphate phosphatase